MTAARCVTAGDDDDHVVRGRFVLSGVTPTTLAGLLGDPAPTSAPGAQVKVNMVLRRLPRLRDHTVTPEQAFGGTLSRQRDLVAARRRV